MNLPSFKKRILAFLIDAIILGLLASLLSATIILLPLAFIIYFFYAPIFLASNARATIGKYMMGISVVDLNGNQLTLQKSFIRLACSLLSGSFFMAGYFFAFFSEKKQTLHDVLAGTIVVDHKYESEGLFAEWLKTMKLLFRSI